MKNFDGCHETSRSARIRCTTLVLALLTVGAGRTLVEASLVFAAENSCAHDSCYQGAALDSSCNPCVTQICADQPDCCGDHWDFDCALATDDICELTCDLLCGDANDDRRISAVDALIALRTAVGSLACPKDRCDFNGDGKVLAADALKILKTAVGVPSGPNCPPALGDPHYVLNALTLPVGPSQANAFAFNLDDDPNHHPDNALGGLLSALADPETSTIALQATIDAAIAGGAAVELASLSANNLIAAPEAAWRFFVGQPTIDPPLFDGSDTFSVAVGGAMQDELEGTITGGNLVAQLPAGSKARLPIKIALVPDQPPVEFDLVGGHVAADITPSGCTNGRIGGGITVEDVNNVFVPALAAALDAAIPDECRAGAAVGDYSLCDSPTRTYLQIFDKAPRDGEVTLAEVSGNAFLQVLLTPDVDLMDADGGYDPGLDGEPDSISFGVGFGCVSAGFAE